MALPLITLGVEATKAILLPHVEDTLTAALRMPSCLEAIADAARE